MTKALDRVKAAESKYTGMVETAEKLEATLKELKDPANSCQSSIWDLHRAVDRHRRERERDFLDVCFGCRGWSAASYTAPSFCRS